VRHTADCLSEEKREGTLGLLFLTDLKGYDVVVGKLVSTSVNAFFGLLAILPIMTVSILMGGITHGELWRVSLVLVNAFFFSLSLGMLLSSLCNNSRVAMGWTFGLLLFFTLGLPLAENWIAFVTNTPSLRNATSWLNPVSAGFLVVDGNFRSKEVEFWISLCSVHGMAWLFLIAASLIVPRSWQDRPAGAKTKGLGHRWRTLTDGGAHERLSHRRRLLDINAYYWLAARRKFKQLWMWFVFAGLAGLWVWGERENRNDWVGMGNYFLTALVLNTVLKSAVASESVRRLSEDRKSGSLELVLSTSLTVRDIIKGQLLALRRHFLWPLCFVLGLEIIYFIIALRKEGNSPDPEEIPPTIGFVVAMMFLLLADTGAMAFVGMWNGLTAKSPNHAAGMTFRKVVVYPVVTTIIATIVTLMLYAVTSGNSPGIFDSKNAPWLFLALYFIPSLVADVVFGFRAWRRLNTQFRHAATQRFAGTGFFWSAFFKRRRGSAESA
jgi:hypothetical protein